MITDTQITEIAKIIAAEIAKILTEANAETALCNDEDEEWTPDNADYNDPGSRHHY